MKNKVVARKIRHQRIRTKTTGNVKVPRLSVFRSNKYIYAQLIDDSNHRTLVSESDTKNKMKQNNIEKAHEVGKIIAQKAIDQKIKNVVFDRGGYKFHGRVKALAQGARKGGLIF